MIMVEPKYKETVWHARAVFMELLAFSFRYPDNALAEVVITEEWADAAVELSGIMKLDISNISFDTLRSYQGVKRDDVLRDIRIEATRLFIGASKPLVSPYEGVWRAEEEDVTALLFVNPYTVEVERFMKSCGLGQAEGSNEPLDYISTELELLQYLAAIEAGTFEPPESIGATGFPAGSAAEAFRLFVSEHVLQWMPRFAEAVLRNTKDSFYHTAAQLLQGYCKQEMKKLKF